MPSLTTYEQKQVREIAGWKAEPPALIVEAMEAITHPMVKLAERFVPEQAVKDAIEVAYLDSEMLAHREDVAQSAQVDDVGALRRGDLARCDRLAEQFVRLAARNATVRGGLTSAGAIVGMELSIMYALKCVHTIGFCYGFTPEDPREREYVFQTLLVASAGTMQEKQQAVVNLRSIEDVLLEEVAEDFIEEEAEAVVEEVVEQAAGSSIPLLGLATQGLTNAVTTYHIGQVAKRVFQERWLRANGKVEGIAPDPQLARSRVQRAESVLAACFYWPSYFVSFAATYPAVLVTSFLPTQNVAVQGFADGGAAASHDLQYLKDRLREAVSTKDETLAAPSPLPVPA